VVGVPEKFLTVAEGSADGKLEACYSKLIGRWLSIKMLITAKALDS
jgi:hypothetical protein